MAVIQQQDPRAFAEALFDPALKDKISEHLIDAVDLHCHSGPAAMPRLLNHYEELQDAAAARFKAVVTKDHFYAGMAHAALLEQIFPDTGVRIFSGIALNNASGGINPHAVDHAAKLGAKIVWMPTLSAANHVTKSLTDAKGFPKTARKLLEPIPISVLGDDGKLTDATKAVLDLIAESDIILAGGHLHVSEQHVMFEEAKCRGVRKMLVNHPTYLIDCTDADMRQLAGIGVYMEHSIVMFIEGMARGCRFPAEEITRLIEVAGADQTLFCSDLGLQGSPLPVDGFRLFVQELLRLQVPAPIIHKVISANGAKLLNLP